MKTEISANETEISRKKALQIFESIRKESKETFPKGMSLKEINDEIAFIRKQSKWNSLLLFSRKRFIVTPREFLNLFEKGS